jgi:two-component system phosphate regulon sensor histidine kinase PhoR
MIGGSVTVEVFQANVKPALRVSDTGIGIPKEYTDRVFERFFRVDKSRSKAAGGTGLGLSIVKHAAAYHGAEIELESTENVGTAITIIFSGG